MVLSLVQRCLLSYMTTLVYLYEQANALDKLDENDSFPDENREELFHDIEMKKN